MDCFWINCLKAIVQVGQNRNLRCDSTTPEWMFYWTLHKHQVIQLKPKINKIITITTIIWFKCSINADAIKQKLCKEISAARFYIKMLLLSSFCSRNWHRFHFTALQTPQCHMLPPSSLEDTFWVFFHSQVTIKCILSWPACPHPLYSVCLKAKRLEPTYISVLLV